MNKACFAAGCFWGVQKHFSDLNGVHGTQVGYCGGDVQNPTYKQVCSGTTNHAEACLVTFNPEIICYEQLLRTFWDIHDPTTLNRQGPDVGSQYRSAIFYYDVEQQQLAETSKKQMNVSGKWRNPIVTEIVAMPEWWVAEEYHQHYLTRKSGFFGF